MSKIAKPANYKRLYLESIKSIFGKIRYEILVVALDMTNKIV